LQPLYTHSGTSEAHTSYFPAAKAGMKNIGRLGRAGAGPTLKSAAAGIGQASGEAEATIWEVYRKSIRVPITVTDSRAKTVKQSAVRPCR
jgi:hypothetical protein